MEKYITIFYSLLIIISFSTSNLYSQTENVGIGVVSPQNKLHVGGKIQSDSLSGSEPRVVKANTDGVFETIPDGNINDYLKLTPQGPEWKAADSNSSGNDCPPFECPSMFSLTYTDAQVYFGACQRYCATLDEDNFTDWRVPSIDEVLILAPIIATEIYGIWTKTTYIDIADPSYPGSRKMVTFNLTTGAMTVIDPSTPQWCKCVR